MYEYIIHTRFNPWAFRSATQREEIDYLYLLEFLKGYKNPRDKIKWLLKKGILHRIKKGLYVFGSEYQKRPHSKEVLANLIYGPSYVSMEYALSFYNLIPEWVETVTSVTCKKNRTFQTPVGPFTYQHCPLERYSLGINHEKQSEEHSFLIASPEKALIDLVSLGKRKIVLETVSDGSEYLFQDLRIQAFYRNQ